MKRLLKGLRYISQIFENEKEPEMKIGMPTDVKHVAHIGWEGPSAINSAPSWMNEFKTPAGFLSAPLPHGEVREEDPIKWVSQDRLSRKGSRGQSSSARDMPELPKSLKRTTSSSTNGSGGSSAKEKTDKAKQSKKGRKTKDPNQGTESTSKDPKKNGRRKKLKDPCGEGSSRRSRTTQDLDTVSESGSQLSYGSDFVEGEAT